MTATIETGEAPTTSMDDLAKFALAFLEKLNNGDVDRYDYKMTLGDIWTALDILNGTWEQLQEIAESIDPSIAWN